MAAPEPDETDPLFDPERDVVTEAAALLGLAHPLRLRLLALLRAYGPSTATKLAARCGESSGLTSYHLRQLAAAGFIVEAEAADLTGLAPRPGRERWWKAARRSTFSAHPTTDDETALAASADYLRAVVAVYAENARSWLSSQHAWPQEWQQVAGFGDVPLRLTPEEVGELERDLYALLARYRRHDLAQPPGADGVPADAVLVTLQFQLFPQPDQEPPPAT